MKIQGYIVNADYDVIEGKTQVKIFGRLENNESFVCIIDQTPYFFIRESDQKKVDKILSKFNVEKTSLTNFKGEKVVKISHPITTEINKLVKIIHDKEIDTYEADIKPFQRFIIDNNILASITLEGDYERTEKVDRLYINPKISPSDFKPNLKVYSIDIETDKSAGNLFCIGIYGEKYEKNFIVSKENVKNAVACKTEAECLSKFRDEINKLDPDILTGWNMIDFDLVYLKNKFKENKIPFDLGRTNQEASIRVEGNFFKSSSANLPGRQVLDAMNLIKDPFIQEAPTIKHADFDTYTLEDVSQAILGEGKILKGKGRHKEIEELYKKNKEELVKYNLQDCKLAYDLLNKTKIIDLAVERSQLTGMLLDRITASIASFDSLYIREARNLGIVSPTTRFSNKEERITGGYVMQAVPGIYHNVLVLDFKSLYPSIIKTFNIDPASFLDKKEKNAIESPNHAYFKNQNGILPQIIEKLHQAREKAKKEKRELSSYAIKIIMNSFFGVLASPNCRYFSLDMANAITHFARFIIQLTAKKVEELGYKVIYSDTDSIFVDTNAGKDKANKLGLEIQDYINNFYKKYVKEEYYNRPSYLEIQFQKHFIAFIMPKTRSTEAAAKKRYAGLVEINGKEEIQITGLEAIRGDWVDAAKEFQIQLLDKVFHNEKIEDFIKEYIKKIRAGKMDDKLVYKKSIRKNLDEYTKTTPPHVKAARKLDKLESNIIQYYLTTDGPEPIQKLKHPIDYDHYIKKQIEPIANQVLSTINKDFKDITEKSSQTKLF